MRPKRNGPKASAALACGDSGLMLVITAVRRRLACRRPRVATSPRDVDWPRRHRAPRAVQTTPKGRTMAEELSARGAPVKIRNPWAPVLLPIITLGIYHLVWYYKIMAEMKAYGERNGDAQLQTINPVRAVLAVFPGAYLLYIPMVISYVNS